MDKNWNLWALFCTLLIVTGSSFSQAAASGQENTATNKSHEEKWTFKLVRIGQTKAADGTSEGFRHYKNVEGTKVALVYGRFKSPAGAKSELHDWRKAVKKVQESTPVKDSTGQITGERFVVILNDKDSSPDSFAIIWTDGPDAWWIGSSSLSAALMFEARIKNGDPLAESDR